MATEPGRQALKRLTEGEPQRHPLVIGFVGAIGIPWDPIIRVFEESFRRFSYSTRLIKLSRLLDDLAYQPWKPLPDMRSLRYYERRMDACDRLRSEVGLGSALAALAISRIRSHRRNGDTAKACVYFLKSLKHPQEVEMLRHVYGDAFFLVGIALSEDERRKALFDSLSRSLGLAENSRADAERLIARDESDPSNRDYGQNVRDTYSMADVFIPANTGLNDTLIDTDRFVDTIFASPFLTPRPYEEGMNFASNAAMRSAAAGRQVGAALIPEIGTPVVAGVNEVPKPGGGQYWEGDLPDYRDFKMGQDPNPIYVRRVMEEVLQRLADNEWLKEELCKLSGPELLALAYKRSEMGESVLAGARASALIEFTRCLHAEQAAIINAARAGVSTEKSVMYTTTFPCHECAKMIIGAGIREVYYIEPFPKSLVDLLYGEMIDTSPSPQGLMAEDEYRIPFYQFVGIAPRRYASFFVAGERKIGYSLVEFDRRSESPRIGLWSELGVSEREASVVDAIDRVIEDLVAKELREKEEPVDQDDLDEGSLDDTESGGDNR